jgi:hypothetical protein
LIDTLREHLGYFIDLASSDEHNEIIGANEYYTEDIPCPDFIAHGGGIWCNPPGPGKEVHRFWDIWNRSMTPQWPGAFLFFNADHMRRAPKPSRPVYVTLLARRQQYRGTDHGASFPSALVTYGIPCATLSKLGHVFLWNPDLGEESP